MLVMVLIGIDRILGGWGTATPKTTAPHPDNTLQLPQGQILIMGILTLFGGAIETTLAT